MQTCTAREQGRPCHARSYAALERRAEQSRAEQSKAEERSGAEKSGEESRGEQRRGVQSRGDTTGEAALTSSCLVISWDTQERHRCFSTRIDSDRLGSTRIDSDQGYPALISGQPVVSCLSRPRRRRRNTACPRSRIRSDRRQMGLSAEASARPCRDAHPRRAAGPATSARTAALPSAQPDARCGPGAPHQTPAAATPAYPPRGRHPASNTGGARWSGGDPGTGTGTSPDVTGPGRAGGARGSRSCLQGT